MEIDVWRKGVIMSNGTHIGHRIARVDTLHPHPRNSEIYGDPRDSQDFTFFVQDCRENGIHPLVIAENGTIIGGHRRYYAALQLGIEELPVAVYRYATPVDMLAALVADNNARIKSNWQLSSEAAVLMEVERERAMQRMLRKPPEETANNFGPELVPDQKQKGDARDAVGAALGVSGKQVDNLLTVKQAVDTLRDAGDNEAADELITLVNRSAKAAAQQARSQMAQPTKKTPTPPEHETYTVQQWETLSQDERRVLLQRNGDKTLNTTNENVEWALWTWNPITGCLHNCNYCYARDIANRFYSHLPDNERFSPVFYPDRLTAPANTRLPNLDTETDSVRRMGLKNIFTCSMADLFGKWVPAEWIHAVIKTARDNPQWNFLFLTKFPIRMAEFEFPSNTWIGTTVDSQYAVERAEKAFRKIRAGGYDGVAWLSCEPMMERLTFSSLDMFDWLVVGGASKSTQTAEFVPPVEWTFHLWQQAQAANVPIYMKTNLFGNDSRHREYPAQIDG
jgi:protein gp37/ParB-like chromosome segregation protein Spo0J